MDIFNIPTILFVKMCIRDRGGEYENVAVLVAIAVNEDGFREVLGAAEGMKEDGDPRPREMCIRDSG